ncbi:MAG: response regulator [Bradyrhizobium sp.]|uniref:response regulator transcription factor n=1 Tax=Bradyrhizobium sp. TaxID=376 RepID=UPI001D3C435C|nr:response regulator [Bradyrhizobium sp.]MBV9566181.1 response regulator [Bradyrhizobium sp.]
MTSTAPAPVISIVDDDESVRLATELFMASLGYRTHLFSSAEEFLRSSRAEETSCLIIDVQMPEMDGIELQAALKARGREIPTIFITAFPTEDIATRARAAGAVCFLTKPFKATALIGCIESALEQGAGGGKT